MVDGSELLCALSCDEHFVVGDVGFHCRVKPGLLLLREVLSPGAENGLYPVGRVALASAVPEGVLFWTRRRTSSTVAVPCLTTWNASRTATASSSLSSIAVVYPANGSGPAAFTCRRKLSPRSPSHVVWAFPDGRQIQRPRACPSLTFAGEVDHSGQPLRSPPERVDVMPDMLNDTEAGDALEPRLVPL